MQEIKKPITRKEKEDYLLDGLFKLELAEDTPRFRANISKLSDFLLDVKIESLDMLLEDDD